MSLSVASPANTPALGAAPRVRTRRARRNVGAYVSLLSLVVVLAIWQASGLFMNPIFISTPSAIAVAFVKMLADGSLATAFLSSAGEMLLGFAISCVIGIGTGILMGRSRFAERAFDPLVAFGNATPTIALLPVMEIWFGLGLTARIAFIVIIGLWTLMVNTLAGMRSVQRNYADVARSFGLSGAAATRLVYVPAAMPYILAGMRIAIAQAAVGMVLSGQEIGEAGLGGLTENFANYYQTDYLIGAICTATALAMIAFFLLRAAQATFFPWISATAVRKS